VEEGTDEIEIRLIGNMSISHQSDAIKRTRLRWRARRGLLENDLLLTRFLDANELILSDEEVDAFSRLMELPDNNLMDLLLMRNEPEGEYDLPHVHALLVKLRHA
jgi:antitoxin CptB